jgi:hypothetical protein
MFFFFTVVRKFVLTEVSLERPESFVDLEVEIFGQERHDGKVLREYHDVLPL